MRNQTLLERILMRRAASKKSGTMPIPGSEGAARRDVSRAGFRRKGPIQKPKVEKSGTDVPIWVRTHKSPAEYAANIAKQKHKEGDKPDVKSLRKQLHRTGATKDSEVHDITVGSPKSKVKEPGQRARQFVGALKTVAGEMKKRKGVATNTPTAISSGGKKRKRSDEEGAEQRGRIYKKLGMGERDPKTGVQMARLGEGKTFREFLEEAKAPKPDALETIQRKTQRRTPGMKYVVHTTSSDDIRVDNIEVPENQRGKGIAKRTFKGLHNYADKIGKNVSLTPVAKPGYKEKLDKMYRNLGYRDRTPSDRIAGADTMIRNPKEKK